MRGAVVVAVVHVLAERTRVRESFAALATLERLLPAVQALVFRQVVLVLERLVAQVTGKWTGTWQTGRHDGKHREQQLLDFGINEYET